MCYVASYNLLRLGMYSISYKSDNKLGASIQRVFTCSYLYSVTRIRLLLSISFKRRVGQRYSEYIMLLVPVQVFINKITVVGIPGSLSFDDCCAERCSSQQTPLTRTYSAMDKPWMRKGIPVLPVSPNFEYDMQLTHKRATLVTEPKSLRIYAHACFRFFF